MKTVLRRVLNPVRAPWGPRDLRVGTWMLNSFYAVTVGLTAVGIWSARQHWDIAFWLAYMTVTTVLWTIGRRYIAKLRAKQG